MEKTAWLIFKQKNTHKDILENVIILLYNGMDCFLLCLISKAKAIFQLFHDSKTMNLNIDVP